MVSTKTKRLCSSLIRVMQASGTSTAEDIHALSLMLFSCAKTMVRTGVYGSRGEALAHIGNDVSQTWVAAEAIESMSEDDANEAADVVAECLINRYANGVQE